MKIKLSPVRIDTQLEASLRGEVLTLNGEEFDFSPLLEGATVPASAINSPWFFGEIERKGGDVSLTLILPHGANAPESTRFPEPITATADGLLELPIYDEVVEDEQHRLEQDGDEGDEGSAGAGGAENSGDPGTPEPEVGS